jgi:DNA mismatch repair protein MSH2
VCVLLAQVGMRVPCDSAVISVCDRILTRVGAGDAALKGVSTFMKEMTEATAILAAATRNSLIIIDELGRGTSTYDGLGLAWSIAESIARELQSFCLISTHFHELSKLDELPGVRNKHVVVSVEGKVDEQETEDGSDVAADAPSGASVCSGDNDGVGGIVMTHRVADGASGKSFGINVAVMAHLPGSVITYARKRVRELERQAQQLSTAAAEDEDEKKEGRDENVEDEETQALQLMEEEQEQHEDADDADAMRWSDAEFAELSRLVRQWRQLETEGLAGADVKARLISSLPAETRLKVKDYVASSAAARHATATAG